MDEFAKTINGIQRVLVICPCCGEIFRLAEGKFIFPRRKPRKSRYLDLVALEKEVSDKDARLLESEARFEEQLEVERERLRDAGRRQAKARLSAVDPNFSGKNVNPQDVRAVMYPVEYIVFHGASDRTVSSVEFVSRVPRNRRQELVVNSVDATIRNGDIAFEVLRMKDDGKFEVQTPKSRPRKKQLA